ncbi:MAG: YkgJ family cysteine cluster protein [Planctomycetes bacterium]|nr:YkgJ family cysteine cluster protein [Planctomycetota bacterium]
MPDNARDEAERLLREKRAGRWYQAGLRFRCLAPDCVDCCSGKRGAGYVWVKVEEMQALAEFLRMEFEPFTRKYVRQASNRYSLIEKPNKDCIFLRDGGCSVYPARPGQCRTYPFWHEVMASEQTWAKESTQCPGINHDAPIVPADEVTRQLNQDRENRGIPARD